MASTRITNSMREDIVTKIVHSRFKERKAALESRRTAFAEAAYAHEFSAEWLAAARALNKLRPGSVKMEETLYINAPDFKGDYRSSEGPSRNHNLSKEHPIPDVFEGIVINQQHPLRKESQDIAKEHLAIIEASKALTSKLTALLHSCNTLKQLREAWPEGEAFYPGEPPSYRTALVPVTLTHEINQMLGIKSKPRSAAQKALAKAAAKTN